VARWHRYDARAKMLIYTHGCKELPPQLYRANVSQPVRPSENFPYISQECPPMADLCGSIVSLQTSNLQPRRPNLQIVSGGCGLHHHHDFNCAAGGRRIFLSPSGPYLPKVIRLESDAHLPAEEIAIGSRVREEHSTPREVVINLKTAKTPGLDIPATLLGRADEVIE
jgi:hypothetical protein